LRGGLFNLGLINSCVQVIVDYTMQQNPYCPRCWNSLVISQESNGDILGICDKCSVISLLSRKEKENYLHNKKCKTICGCGGTAYVHGSNDFYECGCCFKQIPLSNDTKIFLKDKKPEGSKQTEELKNTGRIKEKEKEQEKEQEQEQKQEQESTQALLNNFSNEKPVLVNHRGERFLVIQEPEIDDVIYCGVMQQLGIR